MARPQSGWAGIFLRGCMKKQLLCLGVMLIFLAGSLWAQDGHHHVDANQKLGTVSFPTSCVSSVQKPFERGVALLHSFWYDEAETQFLQVAKEDPQCGMAHWGVAMSLWHQLWDQPNAKVISRGMDEVRGAKK